MAYTFIGNVSANAGGSGNATTGALDTTGANLIVIGLGYWVGATSPSVSDSKGNAWTPLTAEAGGGGGAVIRLFYCLNPTVGAGHTFSSTGTNLYAGINVLAFSGGLAYDQEGAGGNGASPIQPGSITPTNDNELILTALTYNAITVSPTIDGGYTNYYGAPGGGAVGVSFAYLIQTAKAATNPTWTWTGSTGAAVPAAFTAAPTGCPAAYLLLNGA